MLAADRHIQYPGASRLLRPRSGLERSDFVLWPNPVVATVASHVRWLRQSRRGTKFRAQLRFAP
jgi:cytochrome c-type biogenesis protein CcmH/NrfF